MFDSSIEEKRDKSIRIQAEKAVKQMNRDNAKAEKRFRKSMTRLRREARKEYVKCGQTEVIGFARRCEFHDMSCDDIRKKVMVHIPDFAVTVRTFCENTYLVTVFCK